MKAFDFQPEFNKTVLKNGVRIVTEHHINSRTTSAGVFVDLGTRDEPQSLVGAAHFIEHLVFKGTKERTGLQIAKSLEAVGGELNAFTSRENTCFHATTLREHLPLSLDILCDLVNAAEFTPHDFEKERDVILQEIDMSADNLEEHVFDLYFEQAFQGHTLGRPILGTKTSLSEIQYKKIKEFYHQRYRGKNIVVSVAGDVNHGEVVDIVKQKLGRKKFEKLAHRRRAPLINGFFDEVPKDSEQVHLLMGLPSSSFKSPHRFEAYLANALLGGGMTSQLYQKVREKRGLAYSVYSYLHSFVDSGLIMVYAGTSGDMLKKVRNLILAEFEQLKQKGISKSNLLFFKKQVLGQIVMGADDVENRMNSLGVNELVFHKYRPVEQVLNEVASVTQESFNQYLKEYFDLSKLGTLVVGPI